MTHDPNKEYFEIGKRPTEVVDTFIKVDRDNDSHDRPAVYASGDLYTFYTTTRESNGAFNFFDFFLPVNGGPPPHYHPYEHEIWYITDGEIRFNLGNTGEKSIVLPAGTTIFGPINRTHGYHNDDSAELFVDIATPGARTLSMTTPGALDLFFDAAAVRVLDRDEPPPPFTGPTPDDFLNLAKFNARTGAGIVLTALDPDYEPPADSLPYVLILGPDAPDDVVEGAKGLMSDPNFKVWTTGDQEGIPQRPTFIGDFGLTYTSLVNFEETADKFEYNQFSLESNTDNLGFNESEDNKIFYVKGDHDPNTNKQLTITVDHGEHSHSGEDSGEHSEEELDTYTLEENSYFFVAPGNSYSIANEGSDSVEALAITIPQNPEADPPDDAYYEELFPSPLLSPSDNEPNQTINLTGGDDYFNESGDNPDTYRIFFDIAPGYTDYHLGSITINGVDYQGIFESAAINPSTGQLVVDTGVFKFVNGSFAELVAHDFDGGINLEILRDDYRQGAIDMGKSERVGVITQIFFDSEQPTTTIPDVVETLPEDIYQGVSELSKSNPLPENGYTPLPFEDPNRYSNPYDFLVIPAFEFAFDVFRDKPKTEGGLPIPIVGGDQNGDGVGWTVEGYESRRVINALEGNDTVFADKEDTVYGADGDDILKASDGKGGNLLYGEDGNDRILVNFNDRAYGADGNDTLDASQGVGLDGLDDKGRNLLDGGAGADILKASSNNELWGGEGNDKLHISQGGNNLLYGGEGKDQFTILSGMLPETVPVEYSDFAISLLPPGLSFPDLVDTENTIMDFELGVDKIYIQGFTSEDGQISLSPKSFEDLQLLPTFGDLYSTSIIAKFTDNGVEKEISLGNVKGIIFNEFTANDFVLIDKFLVGTAADETLTGGENNDLLRGKDGNDEIVGNAGNDTINGGNDNDNLIGGEGNDRFWASIGNDTLNGGSGKDLLWGGQGEDQFIFASPTEGVDNIKDFTSGEDSIVVSAEGFGSGLVSGSTIESDQLVLGSSSVDANSRFLYDSSTGNLLFDSDGNGATEALLLAKLGSGKVIAHTDILVTA